MKTSPSSLKIHQIITQIKEGKLVPRPEFQRRRVWKTEDKVRFIDTILRGYPFPEIFLANGPIDVDTGKGQQLLVDGQQRITAIFDYFEDKLHASGLKEPRYSALEKSDKESFLNYDIAIRDLGSVTPEKIIDVFRRINSTNYSLTEIEINNAVYQGELMQVATALAEHEFFETRKVFRSTDVRRMGDVRFILQVLITILGGYFNRDEEFVNYLEKYNDVFPNKKEVVKRVMECFSYIDECGFMEKSRIWKKSDLFTALVELERAISDQDVPNPIDAVSRLESFYNQVDKEGTDSRYRPISIYAKASLQASNDRINRLRRGVIFNAVLHGVNAEQALEKEHLI